MRPEPMLIDYPPDPDPDPDPYIRHRHGRTLCFFLRRCHFYFIFLILKSFSLLKKGAKWKTLVMSRLEVTRKN